MHQYTVNAALQLLPVATEKHPYQWVDEAIEIIKNSGMQSEVGAFTTVVEGTYEQLILLINNINEYLFEHKCYEWILGVQMQIRSQEAMTAEEKTKKHR